MVDVEIYRAPALALVAGLLIGIERYKDRSPEEKKPAGVRTFAIVTFLGAICRLPEPLTIALITFGALTLFLAINYYRHSANDPGLTTEFTAMLMFWLGFHTRDHEILVLSSSIILTILLASKRYLHHFARNTMSDLEFYDTLKFLAVVFVLYPMIPSGYFGPGDFFNPSQVWMLIIIVSSISYLGYIFIRLLGHHRGLLASSLLGGLISTTAMTMAIARRVHKNPSTAKMSGATAILANSVQFPRLIGLIWIVSPAMGMAVAGPLLSMFLAGALVAGILARFNHKVDTNSEESLALANPYSFFPALKFGLLLSTVIVLSKLLTMWLDTEGLYLISAIAGLVDVTAISLTSADMVVRSSIDITVGVYSVLIAIAFNAILKLAIAAMNGSKSFAAWLGLGFAVILTTGLIATWFMV